MISAFIAFMFAVLIGFFVGRWSVEEASRELPKTPPFTRREIQRMEEDTVEREIRTRV